MSAQKVESLIAESQSLSQEEKLSLVEVLLSDVSKSKNISFTTKVENFEQEDLAKRCRKIHPAIRPGNPALAAKILTSWAEAGTTEEGKADWQDLKNKIDANRDSYRKLYQDEQ